MTNAEAARWRVETVSPGNVFVVLRDANDKLMSMPGDERNSAYLWVGERVAPYLCDLLNAAIEAQSTYATRLAELEACVDPPGQLNVDLLIDWKSSHFTLEESRLTYLAAEEQFKIRLADLQERLAGLEADVKYLLAFVPDWAKDVPEGLGEMFYGTLSAAGDREVKAKVDEIIARAALTE